MIVLIGFLTCIVFLYVYYKHYAFKYWTNRGVQSLPASFPFGNLGKVVRRQVSFTNQIGEFYEKMKHRAKYAGLYFFHRKVLLIIDPGLSKRILSTDFKYFHSRGIYYDEQNEPLSAHLVSIDGERWKQLRNKVTPTFTPNKLKAMFNILLNCANEMSEVMKNDKTVDVKDLTARYTTDVVGSSAFGIDCHSLQNPEAEFRQIGRLATTVKQTLTSFFKRTIIRSFPTLAKKLKLKTIDPTVSSFFLNAVEETVSYRTNNNIHRNDFLQLLINLMDTNDNSLTIKQVAAQCFVFFIAGVETSASTITFALYELAKNEDMQVRLRDEIMKISDRNNGKLTYEGILEMEYMEKVILETMRKYPAFTVLMRRCTENYPLSDTTVLEKGTSVIIPVYAMHHDSSYFSEPEDFNPERFNSDEEKKKMDNIYLPFGDGPRICIGRRFAMFQVKLALAASLRDYKFTLNEKSKGDLVMDSNSFILSPIQGVYLDVVPVF